MTDKTKKTKQCEKCLEKQKKIQEISVTAQKLRNRLYAVKALSDEGFL